MWQTIRAAFAPPVLLPETSEALIHDVTTDARFHYRDGVYPPVETKLPQLRWGVSTVTICGKCRCSNQGAAEEDHRRCRGAVFRFEVDGPHMFRARLKVSPEGVVSKVRDSRYISGRINDWVKKTCAQRKTLTIAGFALDGNK
jgi:hypothetical protein